MASTLNKRLGLQKMLENICDKVYFSPPSGHKLKYPCIVYNRDFTKVNYGDNTPYTLDTRYSLTVIDPDPDSEIVPQIERLQKCSFDRHFVSDDLNHDVFTIYY